MERSDINKLLNWIEHKIRSHIPYHFNIESCALCNSLWRVHGSLGVSAGYWSHKVKGKA